MTPEAFIIESLLMIPNKEGEDVEFKLNSAQKALDRELTGRDLVPKARQEGVSSYVLARFLVKCLKKRNTRAVVISHDRESTQRLLGRVRYYIEHIKGPAPVLKNLSQNLISFSKTNSTFYIGTAGGRNFGRGDTITDLHCSEYAYWTNPKELMAGLLQAVPYSGEIIIESTGNGFNDYYQRCMRAEQGRSMWSCHFLPWHTFSEYRIDLTSQEEKTVLATVNAELEEDKLVKSGITPGQLAWRRMKLDELDYDLGKFKQEYPMTLDECFQMSSESIFTVVNYEPTDRWKKVDRGFWILEGHPARWLTYVQGADVAAGVGKDSSVSEIFCLETGDQVAEYTSNVVDPEVFAGKLGALGRMFNEAYTVVEQNNHGILTLSTLSKSYPAQKLHRDPATQTTQEEQRLFKLGYRTSVRNKPLMIGRFRTLVREDWKIHSPLMKSQMSTFIEHPNGRLAAQDDCEDDCVMAGACASVGVNRAAMFSPSINPPPQVRNSIFLLDNILKEFRDGGERWPIRDQTWN